MRSSEQARGSLPASIGPYQIVREIGRGGMGIVYEGQHPELRRRVAIKVLRAHLLEDPVNVQRFLREGRAACQIRHPHVVEIYDLSSEDGAPYLAMDLLDGMLLAERISGQGALPLEELTAVMLPVLSAVAAAHVAGVVHRDLKPSNIMLARDRRRNVIPKVLDFGTSKLRDDEEVSLLTLSGVMLGTLHYMSPEQTRAPKLADGKSDQYSLGLVLYECATGKKPFIAESSYELMHAIMTAPVEPPSALNPALSKEFDAIVLRAMARNPGDRFASIRAMGRALLPFASTQTLQTWEAEFTRGPSLELVPLAPATEAGERSAKAAERGRTERAPAPEVSSAATLSSNPKLAVPTAKIRRRRWPLVALAAVGLGLVLAWIYGSNALRTRDPRVRSEAPAEIQRAAASAPPPPTSSPTNDRSRAAPVPPQAAPNEAPPAAAPSKPRTALQPKRAQRVQLGKNGAPILE